MCARLLGLQFLNCYSLSNQRDDIDKAILYLAESLLSSPLSWLPAHGPAILQVFFYLAHCLCERSRLSKESKDAIYAAQYFRYLRGPAHTPIIFRRQQVTALLVETLALQMELKASDTVRTLEEMTALTLELFTSDPSSTYTTYATLLFSNIAIELKIKLQIPELSLDLLNKMIDCLRLARMLKPELRVVSLLLVACLCDRMYVMNDHDELSEVVSVMDEIIASSSRGDEDLAKYQEIVTKLADIRLTLNSHPENSEETIYRARTFLSLSSAEDPLYPKWSQVLERAAKNRFENFGPIDGFEASSSSNLLPPDVAQKVRPLARLLDGIRNNSITDFEEAIELGQSILASSDDSDPSDLQSSHEFGQILFEIFERTKNITYLDESIDTFRQILARWSPKLLRVRVILELSNSLSIRSKISLGHRLQDQHEKVELYPLFLSDASQLLSLPRQFHFACIWAHLARVTQHTSTSTAYETALSLMQDVASFSPTLQLQHVTLTAFHSIFREMTLDYASYQIQRGQLEQAIETLERGRALLWSEMRHLRTSVDQILNADPELGHKFAALNRDLEELTKSIPPSHNLNMDDVVVDDLRAGDQFGSLLMRQRRFLKERDELISQIRDLPGFDRFLTFQLFDALRSAASSGPVVIVNHSEWRSDILILLHNVPPSLISTPTDFYHRANALKDKLLNARAKDRLDSSQYDEALAFVLEELYKLIGKPVVDRLHQLQVPDQSRVWWCPTSVFCSLPLHAMGPIPSDDGERRYFSDLYICSYTPSLSALIQSHSGNSGSRSLNRPSILLVADPSLPTVRGEIQVVNALRDLGVTVTSLISADATPERVINGFRHNQFIHFACHGTLVAGNPFESGFELDQHRRLTLLEIVRADLPTAEFAFLSACHTAEVTEGSIMDEGLHLAAAVQYCGFRSVVGTMWAMADVDGQDLAENFYKALFSNSRGDQGTPFHERSAKALRSAVKKLRRKRGITLERWVNFVHYGA